VGFSNVLGCMRVPDSLVSLLRDEVTTHRVRIGQVARYAHGFRTRTLAPALASRECLIRETSGRSSSLATSTRYDVMRCADVLYLHTGSLGK
jgi:hypothetical protein